jgi:hypothetical protein
MTCDEKREEEKPHRKRPTDFQLSVGSIIGLLTLAASGIATYNSFQNDLATLKKGEQYQERTNERLSDEIKATRAEQRETMREFNDKLDRIIEQWPRRR